jgi:hypothetical protein
MANTKISQLPSWTGTAADLRWFVMNNSGETETFKFSGYSTSITFGAGTNSIKSTNATGAAGTNSIAIGKDTNAGGNDSINIGNSYGTPIGTDSIAIGRHPGLNSSPNQITIGSGAYNNNEYGIAIGHSTSSQQGGIVIGSNTSRATGLNSVSVGNSIENNIGTYSIIIGYNSSCYAPFNGNPYGVVIGSGHRVDNTGYYNTILGGANTTISGASNTFIGNGVGLTSVRTGDIIINSSGNTITGTGQYKISIGGFGNTISGSASFRTIIGGQSNTNSATGSDIIGGQSNTLSTSNSVIVNGISSTISGSGGVSGIYSSQNSTINADGTYNIIIGGFGNTINGSSAAFSSIIGSYNSSLVDRNNSVMLGTSGRTGTSDYTTYVENIHAYRTPSTQVQPISSGTTFTCNLNNGAKSQFYITGTSTINITNVRDGASFMIKTQTDGNYVMTWTATGGYTFVFEGGIKDPGNNVTDIFVFEVFGSVIYGNRRHNYS